MKVLFVCYANIGRSQTAKALYNYWTKSAAADSAGTGVNETFPECATLGELEQNGHHRPSALIVMSEKFGMDIGHFSRTQLTPEMLSHYDLVVNIADRDQTPDWLRGDNVIWWEILDLRETFTAERMWENYEKIARKVKRLIEFEKVGNDFSELDDHIDSEGIDG